MANDYTNAILDTIQSKLSGVALDQIKLELFNTCDELAREALRISPPTNTSAEPDTWLPSEQWAPNYQLLLDGTLARLYGQVGKPYSEANLAKAHLDRYTLYLQLARSEASASPTSVYQRVLYDLRKRIPLARDADFTAAIFAAANKIRVEALKLAPLGDADTTPANWLPSWPTAYQAAFKGALVELYLQADRPWAALELGAATQAQFMQELELLRSDASAAPTTIYDRLIANIRVQIPLIRDSAIALEAFNTADKIRREALWLAPLTETDSNPQNWFPSGQWDNAHPAMLHGTLARLFAQTDRPWSNPQLAELQYQLYVQELELLRQEQAAASSTNAVNRLIDQAQVRLPGARENIIKMELFAALNEFFTKSNSWIEEIEFDVNPAETEYYLTPNAGLITRIMSVTTDDGLHPPVAMTEPGVIALPSAPGKAAVWTARVAITVAEPTTKDGFPQIPAWFYQRYQNAFLDGLLGRMMAQLAKPYTNPALATYHERRFLAEIAVARSEAQRRYIYGGQVWRFPQSFNRRKTYR